MDSAQKSKRKQKNKSTKVSPNKPHTDKSTEVVGGRQHDRRPQLQGSDSNPDQKKDNVPIDEKQRLDFSSTKTVEDVVGKSRGGLAATEDISCDSSVVSEASPKATDKPRDKTNASRDQQSDKCVNSKKLEDDSTAQSSPSTVICEQSEKLEKPGPALADGADVVQKSKSDLRKERRAIQEAQRAAKQMNSLKQSSTSGTTGTKVAQSLVQKPQQQQQQQLQKPQHKLLENDASASQIQTKKSQGQSKKPDQAAGLAAAAKDAKLRVPDMMQLDDEKMVNRIAKKLEKKHIPTRPQQQKKVSLFKHLHQYEHDTSLTSTVSINSGAIHPEVLKLGLQYAHGVITGSKARCIALLRVLKEVIDDYQTPDNKDLARDLDSHLSPFISFLNQCRQHSVSMGNAIKYIKHHINNTPSDCPDKEAKENLKNVINKFYHERIILAAKAISEFTFGIIEEEDVVLVYACSSLVRKVLAEAHSKGKIFSVIVIDGRPKLEGVAMVNYLREHGIKCSYVHINAISHVMAKVTKVLLGAHAILANGYVMSRIGTAQVCLIAKVFDVNVFVCCESYKFCDRVQPDSFVFNELGDPDDLAKVAGRTTELAGWRSTPSLYLLNLLYDVTPHELVTLVITDVGVIQPTSVPMVLRVKNPEAY